MKKISILIALLMNLVLVQNSFSKLRKTISVSERSKIEKRFEEIVKRKKEEGTLSFTASERSYLGSKITSKLSISESSFFKALEILAEKPEVLKEVIELFEYATAGEEYTKSSEELSSILGTFLKKVKKDGVNISRDSGVISLITEGELTKLLKDLDKKEIREFTKLVTTSSNKRTEALRDVAKNLLKNSDIEKSEILEIVKREIKFLAEGNIGSAELYTRHIKAVESFLLALNQRFKSPQEEIDGRSSDNYDIALKAIIEGKKPENLTELTESAKKEWEVIEGFREYLEATWNAENNKFFVTRWAQDLSMDLIKKISSNPEQMAKYIESGSVPEAVMTEVLLKRLEEAGFRPEDTIEVNDGLSDEAFGKMLKEKRLFLDQAFDHNTGHGVFIHIWQVDMARVAIKEAGLDVSKLSDLYQAMGETKGTFKFENTSESNLLNVTWFTLFDAMNGSLGQPEIVNPIISDNIFVIEN